MCFPRVSQISEVHRQFGCCCDGVAAAADCVGAEHRGQQLMRGDKAREQVLAAILVQTRLGHQVLGH